MTQEEENVYKQLVFFKQEYEKLYVIYEELDDLLNTGYNGPIVCESTDGLISAYKEYKKLRISGV